MGAEPDPTDVFPSCWKIVVSPGHSISVLFNIYPADFHQSANNKPSFGTNRCISTTSLISYGRGTGSDGWFSIILEDCCISWTLLFNFIQPLSNRFPSIHQQYTIIQMSKKWPDHRLLLLLRLRRLHLSIELHCSVSVFILHVWDRETIRFFGDMWLIWLNWNHGFMGSDGIGHTQTKYYEHACISCLPRHRN